jgi:sulfur relay (sulfurtransferase) complex TusBCD TusD component (DsrE family)
MGSVKYKYGNRRRGGRPRIQETAMAKRLTIFLTTSPYGFENTSTVLRLAEVALAKGHQVLLHATGDGVYNFLAHQQAKGVPHVEEGFQRLLGQGLKVEL